MECLYAADEDFDIGDIGGLEGIVLYGAQV